MNKSILTTQLTAKIFPIIALLGLPFAPLTAWADIIVKKDGTTLNVFNVEVGQKYITYTKEADPDSELGRVNRDECFAIKTDDGEMKSLEEVTSPSPRAAENAPATSQPTVRKSVPTRDNKSMIDAINALPSYRDQEDPNKFHKGLSLVTWNIGDGSVLADHNMVVGIEPITTKSTRGDDWQFGTYSIAFSNKTDSNLYIDLTNSFKMDGNDVATPFYDGAVYSTGTGSQSGGSVNMGAVTGALGIGGAAGTLANGINLGGGSSKSAQVTKADQPVIVVPPHSKVYLPLEKKVIGKEVVEIPEIYYYAGGYSDFLNSAVPQIGNNFSIKEWKDRAYKEDQVKISGKQLQLHKKGFVEIKEEDSPKTYKYLISYSADPNFSTTYQTNISIYLSGIYGFKPISKSTGVSGKLNDFISSISTPVIWGFGSILE